MYVSLSKTSTKSSTFTPYYIKKMVSRVETLFTNRRVSWDYDQSYHHDIIYLFSSFDCKNKNGLARSKREDWVKSCKSLLTYFCTNVNLNPNYQALDVLEIKTVPISVICAETNLSKSTVVKVLKTLKHLGYIKSSYVVKKLSNKNWVNYPSRRWVTYKFLGILGLSEAIFKNVKKRLAKKILSNNQPNKMWVSPARYIKPKKSIVDQCLSSMRDALCNKLKPPDPD